MHILIGALVGCFVSVALTFVASKVIDKPLTWKDITASAMAGIIGGAVATATIGVGAATTLRTVAAFSAGGATGSASGQLTDNVLHGHPLQEGVVKSTAFGTIIGAGTLGLGKAAAPLAKHAGKLVGLGRGATSAAGSSGGHSNALAGAAAGVDDAIVPVWRYVKKALAEDEPGGESEPAGEGHSVQSEPAGEGHPVEVRGGMQQALHTGVVETGPATQSADEEAQTAVTTESAEVAPKPLDSGAPDTAAQILNQPLGY
jgi:hypothetical protein